MRGAKTRMKKQSVVEPPQSRLDGAVGGADEVAEDGYVGAVGTDTAGVHGKAELFGLFEINASVIEFRQAKTLRG